MIPFFKTLYGIDPAKNDLSSMVLGIVSSVPDPKDINLKVIKSRYKKPTDEERLDGWLARAGGGIGTYYNAERSSEAAYFYAPYIPLQVVGGTINPMTFEPPPNVTEITDADDWTFGLCRDWRDARAYYEWKGNAGEAFEWIKENVPQEHRIFSEGPEGMVLVRITDKGKATLFKLLWL